MVFSSLTFLFAYLPLTLLVYFLAPLKWRNWVLLVVSLIFYGWDTPAYILIMILSTLIDFTHGLLVEKYRADDKKARWFVAQSAIFNTIDVYRKDAPVQRNLVDFGTFVTMFPQLIAGPVVQYKTVAAALKNRINTSEDFALGARRFCVGLAKKVLLANSIGALWDTCLAASLPMGSRSILISPVIPIWPSVWGRSSGSASTRTSTIPTPPPL